MWRCCRFAEAAVAVCEYVLWLHSGEADVQGGRETLIVVDVNTLCPECMYYSYYYIAYILLLYCSSGLIYTTTNVITFLLASCQLTSPVLQKKSHTVLKQK